MTPDIFLARVRCHLAEAAFKRAQRDHKACADLRRAWVLAKAELAAMEGVL